MMNRFNELPKGNKGLEIKMPIFGTQQFLDIANGNIFAKQVLECTPYDRDKIGLFFDQMTQGLKLHISVMSNFDQKRNLAYFHVSIRSENGSRGYKLPDIEGISKLIDIYIDGKHNINLNLEDVYNEALAV